MICFLPLPSSKSRQIKQVELLPVAWVFVKKNKYFCKYPPPEEYNKVTHWVKDSKEYDDEWEDFEVKILSECGTKYLCFMTKLLLESKVH